MLRALALAFALAGFTGVPASSAASEQKPGKPKPDPAGKKDDKEEIDAPDVADIPTQDLRLGKDAQKRYLLDGPIPGAKEPKDGFGLLIVMPGGEGTANFHPFVKRVYKNAVPEGFLLVQPVPVKWKPDQQTIWPTEKSKVPGMKYTTEDFVEAIIEELGKARKIDPARVFTLSWSSSGPAAYVISTTKKGLVKGSLIAMSVFHREELDLDLAKDRAYYILHSKGDKTCPFALAEQARDTLRKKGAKVEFATYEGEHGWGSNVFGDIRTGLEWLLDPKEPAQPEDGKPAKPGKKSKQS